MRQGRFARLVNIQKHHAWPNLRAAGARLFKQLFHVAQPQDRGLRLFQIVIGEMSAQCGKRLVVGELRLGNDLVDGGRGLGFVEPFAVFQRGHQQHRIFHRVVAFGQRRTLHFKQMQSARHRMAQRFIGIVDGDGLGLRQGPLARRFAGEAVGMDDALEAEIIAFDLLGIEIEALRQT